MKANSKFISGKEYSLSKFFGDDIKIIIPDLQRDYCWGDKAFVSSVDKKPRELVTGFIKNIVELFNRDKNTVITLGLIYGYEQPYNHIQICDGQQRLTTLFLLLGYINIKTGGAFNNFLISEREMKDDYEPHLQYAIRESTLYFLSDLSRFVFIEQTVSVKCIKSSDWYFNEYDQDTSIQSMISALELIDKYFSDLVEIADFTDFGNFILNNLRMLYYDMGNRLRGEETYVVINTTGEPLSPTENIKPILLGNLQSIDSQNKYASQWEEREDWFWQNRGTDVISDKGMQEFFVWYWQIGLIQENNWIDDKKAPLNPFDLFLNNPCRIQSNSNEICPGLGNYNKFRSLDNLDKYFNALKTLVEEISNNIKIQRTLLSIKVKKNDNSYEHNLTSTSSVWSWLRAAPLDVVLPLIAFVAEYGINNTLYPFIRRLRKNHYNAVWNKIDNEISRRGKNYLDWRYLIQIINQTKADNILTADVRTLNISKIPSLNLPLWYDEDEQYKDELKKSCPQVEEMEDNEYLMGDLTPLWTNSSDMSETMNRWDILKRMCDALNEEKAKNDIEFANWFRLYRLIAGVIGFGHITNCNWTFEGCFYSRKHKTAKWIESKEIQNVLCSSNPLSFMKLFVKEKVSEYINRPRNNKELVKSWMTLKTVQADKGGYLINYFNDRKRAISAFFDMMQNYIIPMGEFHWGNIFCGYSYSYTIFPARDNYNWERKDNLDSPISSIKFISKFNERSPNVIDITTIEKADIEIKQIIDSFFDTSEI